MTNGENPSCADVTPRAQARVDLAALAGNVQVLAQRAKGVQVMAVVKADAYGHGLVPCARAARQGGAGWLGTALLAEALQLRAAAVPGPILAWLWAPGEPQLAAAVEADIDVAAYAGWAVQALVAAGQRSGKRPRVHLKVDTGLLRGGATDAPGAHLPSAHLPTGGCRIDPGDRAIITRANATTPTAASEQAESGWEQLLREAGAAQRANQIEVVGIFSHLVSGEIPGGATTHEQLHRFTQAVEQAASQGIQPQVKHLANSGGILTAPETHLDLVRPGIACYGLSPDEETLGPPQQWGLKPVMILTARVALVKQVAGELGVSYGHHYRTPPGGTRLALVPLGYADGLPRAASNRGQMMVGGKRHTIAGRVCMDQVVLDVGDTPVQPGDEVVLFGPGEHGEPTAAEWATWCDTIAYEITTRLGPRVLRTYTEG